jgi:hypothetical protein
MESLSILKTRLEKKISLRTSNQLIIIVLSMIGIVRKRRRKLNKVEKKTTIIILTYVHFKLGISSIDYLEMLLRSLQMDEIRWLQSQITKRSTDWTKGRR